MFLFKNIIIAFVFTLFFNNVFSKEGFVQIYDKKNYEGTCNKVHFNSLDMPKNCVCVNSPGTNSAHWDLNYSLFLHGVDVSDLIFYEGDNCSGKFDQHMVRAGWGDQAFRFWNNGEFTANSFYMEISGGRGTGPEEFGGIIKDIINGNECTVINPNYTNNC